MKRKVLAHLLKKPWYAMFAMAAVATAVAENLAIPTPMHVVRVGPHRTLTRIADAALHAKSGDTVLVDAGDYVGDVASWPQSNLTIRAVGGRARLNAGNRSAEGKAIWVIKGDHVLVENFEFAGTAVPDGNGAGIRHEGGHLTVRNCLFEGNQMGLLTWNDERAELTVERSEFRFNKAAPTYRPGDPIGHQIYVGSIGRFTLRDSYVHHGSFGHLVKSRARENHIVNNRLTDEASGRASYELEFPNGGIAYVLGNIIQQGPGTENTSLVSFGAEGYRWPSNELYLANNTLIDASPAGGSYVRVNEGADRVAAINNLLVGDGAFDLPTAAKSAGNARAGPDDLPLAAAHDYRLARNSKLIGKAVEPGVANGVSLRLEREYAHPLGSRPLPSGVRSPGAMQSVLP